MFWQKSFSQISYVSQTPLVRNGAKVAVNSSHNGSFPIRDCSDGKTCSQRIHQPNERSYVCFQGHVGLAGPERPEKIFSVGHIPVNEKNPVVMEMFSINTIDPGSISQGHFRKQDFPKLDGTNGTVKKDFEVVGKSFPPDFQKASNPLPVRYSGNKVPKATEIGKSDRKVLLPAKGSPAEATLVTNFSASGFAKPNSFSHAEWTPDSVSPKAMYFFMRRLYPRF